VNSHVADAVAPSRARLVDLVGRSQFLIASNQSPTGSFPASPTYPVYKFSWFRDGAFVADGLSRHGEVDRATAFHDWCRKVLESREARVDKLVALLGQGLSVNRAEFLPTRYTLEGLEAHDDWWNFQLDGYGSWLWGLVAHLRRHKLDAAPYRRAIGIAARYLLVSWELPCYDWWEEHPSFVHVSTLGSIAAGLGAVVELEVLGSQGASDAALQLQLIRAKVRERGTVDGHLVKWLGGQAVDASLLACLAPFDVVDASTAKATLKKIEADLVVDNGVYRYSEDTFYGGGRWPLLAGFLGLARLRAGDRDGAYEALVWMASAARSYGELPEQVSTRLLHPTRSAEWVQRWGPVACPLLWSHGMYLVLADELGLHL
jgi:isomaltose glucohydrolase